MSHAGDRDFLFLLNDVARLIRTRADKRARAFGMTRAQWVVLSRLERQPGLSQNEMAAILELEPITVARLIDRLESAGFVERRADAKDRRIWRLHLTRAAEPILAKIKKNRAELHAETTAGLSAQRIEQMIEGFLHLKANLTHDGRNLAGGRGAKPSAERPAKSLRAGARGRD